MAVIYFTNGKLKQARCRRLTDRAENRKDKVEKNRTGQDRNTSLQPHIYSIKTQPLYDKILEPLHKNNI